MDGLSYSDDGCNIERTEGPGKGHRENLAMWLLRAGIQLTAHNQLITSQSYTSNSKAF